MPTCPNTPHCNRSGRWILLSPPNPVDWHYANLSQHSTLQQEWQMNLAVSPKHNRLIGLVVKGSALRAEDLVFESHLHQDFSRSSHTSDLKIGTPVATLPGAWCYRVSAGTGRPSVSILWLGEVESLIWGVIGSVLGLVGPVSVYCDWVR